MPLGNHSILDSRGTDCGKHKLTVGWWLRVGPLYMLLGPNHYRAVVILVPRLVFCTAECATFKGIRQTTIPGSMVSTGKGQHLYYVVPVVVVGFLGTWALTNVSPVGVRFDQ